MHVKHDLRRLFTVQCEENLQHLDHEVHGREVIVQQHHLVQRGARHLGFRGGHHGTVIVLSFLIWVVCHGASINRGGRPRMQGLPAGCADGAGPAWTNWPEATKMAGYRLEETDRSEEN